MSEVLHECEVCGAPVADERRDEHNRLCHPTEATNDDLVIWWISDEDRREMRMVHMPHYLYDEIIDSMGRGARGRLWVAPQFGDVDVSAVFNTGDAITYRAHSAGFVLTRKDAADYEIADLDIGVLTDLAMNELTVESV